MTDRKVRGRFAPSPSGRIHLGNAFCALTAWLSARSQGGEMLLRIEDLDRDRCRPEYTAQLIDDLIWLGFDWDIPKDGEMILQSERDSIYENELAALSEKLRVYPCFCTRAELHTSSAPHLSDGRTIYSGRCRNLSPSESERLSAVRKPALRMEMPDLDISFHDGVYGDYSQNLARECGDILLRRSDKNFTYQFAVTVDDALMGVTEVVRGRDLLSSTPAQIFLHRTMGYHEPSYLHIPLLTAPDGRRLSKRDKDLDLGKLRERFSSPEPIIGRLAFLAGWLDRPEGITARELIPYYSTEVLRKKAGAGDIIIDAEDFAGR